MILKQQHNSLFIRAIQIISWNSSLQVIADLCFAICPTTDAEEAEIEQFYEDLQPILELTPKKKMPFSS